MTFKVQVSVEELRKRKLYLATPMYGGQCSGIFARSVLNLGILCTHYQIPFQFFSLFNESLIHRARAYCSAEFMRSDFTNFLFLDADIGFDPQDVIAMLAMQDNDDPENKYDVVCAPYPKKMYYLGKSQNGS